MKNNMLFHKHKFIIPFKFAITDWQYDGDGSSKKPHTLVATSFMCICGAQNAN